MVSVPFSFIETLPSFANVKNIIIYKMNEYVVHFAAFLGIKKRTNKNNVISKVLLDNS